jgi:hypothetical protein
MFKPANAIFRENTDEKEYIIDRKYRRTCINAIKLRLQYQVVKT